MASGPEVVLPIGTQKHDPAWKHCLMVRVGGRNVLKCVYCMKRFQGGGIHRIKEHLAKQKGNASRCPKVPPEVQDEMQLSLDGAASRKKKKPKPSDEAHQVNPEIIPNQTPPIMPIQHALVVCSQQQHDMVPLDTLDQPLEPKPNVGVPERPGRGRRKRAHAEVAQPNSPPAILTQLPMTVVNSARPLAQNLDREQVYLAIGRFLYEAGVPLEAVNSAYFQPMIDAIQAAGPGLEQPSFHDLRGRILKKSAEDVNSTLEHHRIMWSRTGCSLLADEWITDTGKTSINFLVYCPEGTVYLESCDASAMISSPEMLYRLLRHAVEKVGVSNVVQVITNCTDAHVLAGEKLMDTFPTLFWTPCASRCIEAMLDDIGKMEAITNVIENSKCITGFIYNHATVLNLMRKYTNGKDLLAPCENISAFNFITLKRMLSQKDNLRELVISQEWMLSPYSKKSEGLSAGNLISSLPFWSSCSAVVQITEHLVRLLKMVDNNKRPSMGYIHVGLYEAKDAIRKVLVKKSDYLPYWNIIDSHWGRADRHLQCSLHAAGFFLNPKLFYSVRGDVSKHISSAVLDCIERLVPEGKLQDKTQKELNMYRSAAGDFGRKMAVRARNTLLPAEWWSTYGGACPNLTRLATRILSQCCSAKGCDRNHIPFEQIHDKGINLLEHQRITDLVFVRYNLRLQQKQFCESKCVDPISIENHKIARDWISDKTGMISALDGDSNWTLLDQPVAQEMQSEYATDEEFEAFISEVDDNTIQGAARGMEDDDDCKEEEDSRNGASFGCD